MGEVDAAELAEALGAALREEGTFHRTVAAEVLDWAGQVSIGIPSDEQALDAFVADWQLAEGPSSAPEARS